MQKTQQLLFSVIIPALNEEHFLPLLLEDLKNQEVQNFEVIVVDGKSEDKTVSLARSFAKDFSLTIVMANKRHLAYQRNQGAQKAKGEYLMFLDADSRINNAYTKQIENAVRAHVNKVFLPVFIPSHKTVFNLVLFYIARYFVQGMQYLHKPLSFGPAILMKADLFHVLQGFNESLYASEDQDIIIRAYKQGEKAFILSHVPVIYSMRRFEKKGTFNVVSTYVIFILQTLFTGGVRTSKIKYDMGGDVYEDNNPAKK